MLPNLYALTVTSQNPNLTPVTFVLPELASNGNHMTLVKYWNGLNKHFSKLSVICCPEISAQSIVENIFPQKNKNTNLNTTNYPNNPPLKNTHSCKKNLLNSFLNNTPKEVNVGFKQKTLCDYFKK